jgi:hypothetical protein
MAVSRAGAPGRPPGRLGGCQLLSGCTGDCSAHSSRQPFRATHTNTGTHWHPIAAEVDIANPGTIALGVAEAVTRAYAAGRNHRPRRKDGKTPFELYRDRDQSPDAIHAAVAILRKVKERIDTRLEREAASRDPYVRATLEDACARFGFKQEGDLPASLAKLPLDTVQVAVAVYAAKQRAQSLPADAGLRYFAGIARQCQYERELQLFEGELVSVLSREDPSSPHTSNARRRLWRRSTARRASAPSSTRS